MEEASRVRRERDADENVGAATPSKKRRQGVPGEAGEGGRNGVEEGEKCVQEGPAGGGGDASGGEGADEGAARPGAGVMDVYKIPSYAAWFRWDKVHPVERRAMSEFFDKRSGAKTPRIYKEYRDFIINKYRENPRQALTFTEVRRMLIGDVNSLSRVFEFLEHWGLINQQVAGEAGAAEGPGPALVVMDPFPSGMSVVRMPVVSGGGRMGGMATLESSGRSISGSHANNLSTHKNVYSPGSKKAGGGGGATTGFKKAEEESVHCCLCKKDCSKQRYDKSQEAGTSFCLDCVKKGKLPGGTSAGDLVQVSGSEATVTVKEWTSKETLLLLEAVSRFGENWTQVAAHVPTRSKVECVNHFIQLPFGDSYCVEPEEAKAAAVGGGGRAKKNAGKVGGASSEEGVVRDDAVANGGVPSASRSEATADGGGGDDVGGAHELVSPFTDTSHPLFSQVALLAGMVGPRVAAAAAQAAVAAIAEDEPGVAELPFMQRAYFGQKGQGGQSLGEWLMEEPVDALQSNGEGSLQGDKPSTLEANVPPDEPGASKPSEGDGLPSAAQARISVATALGVAAANAKLLADQEEQEIEHLVASVVDNQMKKLYSKLEHFEELEKLLEKERLEVERARQQVYADRLRYAEAQTAMAKCLFPNPALS